ncbi:MAG: 3'-5' exonuclease [Bacteroidota bacterium]|nr:3'-5' exonuclease [Bacteroidota bacterium]
MTFTAIDFETAHANFPCEIGLTRVEDGEICESKSWLIKPACFPYMNPWNQRVHGISSSDVSTAQTFEELWGELKPWMEDRILVAHNAAFDMRVLRATLACYDLAIPRVEYFCSVIVSRKAWKELPRHTLDAVSNYHHIQFNHHRAGDDAEACAKIALKAFETVAACSVEDGLKKFGMQLKKL